MHENVESIDTIHKIAIILAIPYEEVLHACQEMLATTPEPHPDPLSYIYQEASSGKTLTQIQEGFSKVW